MTLLEQRTLALAGLLQACTQVQNLARTGQLEQNDFDTALKSILVLDAMNTSAVFGGVQQLRNGLTQIRDGALSSANRDYIELLRYVMSLIHLQGQLFQNKAQLAEFATEVERLSAYSGDELISQCSRVYQEHISVMRPQIIVQGEQGYLQREDIPPRVRTLLLAGIRAAVLWQQKGGGKLRLIWERSKMRRVATRLLSNTLH